MSQRPRLLLLLAVRLGASGCAAVPIGASVLLYWFFAVRRLHERRHARRSAVLVANLLAIALAASLVVLGGELYFRFVYDTTDAVKSGFGT